MGKAAFEHRALSFPDPVGPDPGALYVDPEWTFDLLVLGLYELGGMGLILAAVGVLAALSGWAMLRLAESLVKDPWAALGLAALGVAGVSYRFAARPQSFFLVLLPLVIWLARERRWLPLFGLGLFWSQSHSSFVLAPFVMLGAAWPLTRRDWPLLLLLPLPLVGPFGLEIIDQVLTHSSVEGIEDMSPADASWFWPPGLVGSGRSLAPLILELQLVVGAFGLVRIWRDPSRWLGPFALALLGLALSLTAVRFFAAATVLALPFAAQGLALGSRGRWWALLLVPVLPYLFWAGGPRLAPVAGELPFGVESRLPEGLIFNDYDSGGYLGWQGPARVFIDGRTPVHFDEVWFARADEATRLPEAFFALDQQWGFDGAVVPKRAPLCEALDARWGAVWSGEAVALFLPGRASALRGACEGISGSLARCEPAHREAWLGELSAVDGPYARRVEAALLLECGVARPDEARRALELATEQDPDSPDLPWLRAVLALREGDEDALWYWLDQAGDGAEPLMLRLALLEALGDEEDLQRELERAERILVPPPSSLVELRGRHPAPSR